MSSGDDFGTISEAWADGPVTLLGPTTPSTIIQIRF